MNRRGRTLWCGVLLLAAAAPSGCVVVWCDTEIDSRERVVLSSKAGPPAGGAIFERLGDGRATLRLDATTTRCDTVAERVESSGRLHAAVEGRTADVIFSTEAPPCSCLTALVVLPAAVVSPLVTGATALARYPFAGDSCEINHREETRVESLVLRDAWLRDAAGHALAIGTLDGAAAPLQMVNADLVRASLGEPPWHLDAVDAGSGLPCRLPVEVR